jgi:AraC-like DNA-binding protein
MTLGRYMDDLLLQRAQQMLLSSEESISRIAEQLGFCDQFYFSRYFRQRLQETPSQYRRRLRMKI